MNNTDRNIFAPKDPITEREDQATIAAAWALAIINLTGVHGIGPLCADDWAMFDAEAQSLLAQVLHHLIAVHALGVAGEVLYDGSLCELTASLNAAVFYRAEVGASSVYCSSVACRTAAHDEATHMFSIFHFY